MGTGQRTLLLELPRNKIKGGLLLYCPPPLLLFFVNGAGYLCLHFSSEEPLEYFQAVLMSSFYFICTLLYFLLYILGSVTLNKNNNNTNILKVPQEHQLHSSFKIIVL